MKITKSMMKTYKTCPLQFKFKHIDSKSSEVPPAEVTTTGSEIHNIFNKFFDSIDLAKIPDNPYDYFCNVMDVDEKYKSIYYSFCEWEAELYKINKESFMPVMREKWVSHDDLIGIIDRVNFNGTDYSIIDYKSSVYNPSEVRFELCLYKYILDHTGLLEKPIKYIGAYGYKDSSKFIEEVKQMSYNLMLKKVEAFRALKFDEISYPAKHGWHCKWCDFPVSCRELKPQRRITDF